MYEVWQMGSPAVPMTWCVSYYQKALRDSLLWLTLPGYSIQSRLIAYFASASDMGEKCPLHLRQLPYGGGSHDIFFLENNLISRGGRKFPDTMAKVYGLRFLG